MEEDKEETKTLTYSNGTVLIKKVTKAKEDWEVDNKSLADIKFTIDLSKCKNVKFKKEEDAEKTTKTVKVEYGKKKKLFTLIKTPPFTMDPVFSKTETPIPLEEQKKAMKDIEQKMDELVSKAEGELMKHPLQVMDVNKIKELSKKLGFDHFIDPTFPPKDISIYNQLKMSYPYKKVIHWRRPKEFMKNPKLFDSEIDPNDIKQGFLGNCWFLCAVGSLAERPSLVKRLFITQEYNEFGYYKLRICKNGDWVEVIVDDYIPCYYNAGPIFAHSKGDELWVLLLEKAYAKLHGNYYSLKSGYSYHGMIDLTGCPTRHVKFPTEKESWVKIEEKALEFFEMIKEADDKGYLITASTPGKDNLTTGEGKKPKAGLVPGHAYSVIQVKEYKDIKLLNIRNPWGRFEWDGDWSDTSPLWTQKIKDFIKPVLDSEDGSFWMWLKDFFMKFKSVTFWNVENWEELRLRGKFIKVKDAKDSTQDYVISKFYYSFDVDEDDTKITIGIHQEDKRWVGSHLRAYLDITFIVLKRDEDDEDILEFYDIAEISIDRETFKDFTFDQGSYVVVPFTTGGLMQFIETSKEELKEKKTK